MKSAISTAILVILATNLACSHSDAYSHQLRWQNITNALERGALCNDFSTAGYFIRRQHSLSNTTKSKWVIFLESGGGCTNPQSCNARFIDQQVRKDYTRTVDGVRHVDVMQAWNDYHDRPLNVTSKLMTSLWRFSDGLRVSDHIWIVEGRGILSVNSEENPDFHDYNHVLIPYCSSDLWLKKTNDFVLARNSSFQFDPNATYNQFTFRGATIFQSVIQDLFEYHGLQTAGDVMLAGSSAGGVGAMNHASWLREQLLSKAGPESSVYCLMDSSWFINFRGSIEEQFHPEDIQEQIISGEIHNTCQNHSDDPSIHVCISSAHFLTRYNHMMKDIPTLALFSRYDLYLLLSSLQHVGADVLAIMRLGSEYSGSMNASVMSVAEELPSFSYFVSSCFQHVYLATSSLWGEGSVLGTAGQDGELENNRFSHQISSEVWTNFHLEHLNSSLAVEHISIQQAVHEWLEATKKGDVVRYQDYCSGPHCNPQCPETILLGDSQPYWGTEVQAILLAIVMFISLGCLMIKIMLGMRDKLYSHKQKQFVEWNSYKIDDDTESVLPYCKDSEAISVACLNLRYSVRVKNFDLSESSSPAQRKRLLSLAAAESESVRVWRRESREESEDCGDGGEFSRRQLDSETGQAMISEENDLAKSIRQFQEMHKQKSKNKGLLRGHHHRKQSLKHENKKEILKGITTYFNPGELVAIMGPSGSGKTTFLDLLAGRRNGREDYQGELLVNGIPMDEARDWYVANTGYVLQLATPYYEELTVRENITLAAQMRLPKSLSFEERFERVEQVMKETGLYSLASTVVGGATGPGLSGGQKRRLCVALQLVNVPSLIFLDEPTSGLDAASSLELLSHLHRVASSNRAVILTIHQPRLEIFHMFDKVILLCHGQIAYHGIPEKAYEVFLEAHQAEGMRTDSLHSKNPADAIMDMLGSKEARAAILNYYQNSDEPEAVENAIEKVRSMGRESVSSNQVWVQRSQRQSGVLNRVSCLESRASKRAGLGQTLYLPVIFAVYGILLGTVYIQTSNATLLLSGYGVFSCASGLFMFPIIYTYLYRALEIFSLEYSDGVGSSIELVLQTFLRFSSLALLPNLFCSTAIYLLVVPYSQYDLWVLTQTTVFAIALNHTWVALLVFVITTRPAFAHRISPVLSAVAGFAGGFFVPPRLMPPWYSWLFYINPNFYGFSAMARVLFQEIDLGCQYQSPIECYPSTGAYLLTYFDLHIINPYLNLSVLLLFTLVFLGLAWLTLNYRHAYILPQLKKGFNKRTYVESSKTSNVSDEVSCTGPHSPLDQLHDEVVPTLSVESEQAVSSSNDDLSEEFRKVTLKPCRRLSLSMGDFSTHQGEGSHERGRRFRLKHRGTISRMLQDGEKHQVWTPGLRGSTKHSTSGSQVCLEERRKSIFHRINTYRCGGSNSQDGSGRLPSKPGGPYRDTVSRRMAQWKKIEEEASKLDETGGGYEFSQMPLHHLTSDLSLQEVLSPLNTPHPKSQPPPSNPTLLSLLSPSCNPRVPLQNLPHAPLRCYRSLPSSPLVPASCQYIEQPTINNQPSTSTTVCNASFYCGNLGITNPTSVAFETPYTTALQNKKTTSKSSSSLVNLGFTDDVQQQPQYFIFPEVSNALEQTCENTPDTGGLSNVSASDESSPHSSAGSQPLPGFQMHTPLCVNSSHTPPMAHSHTSTPTVPTPSPTQASHPTLAEHTESHKIPPPLQLRNPKQASTSRVPGSPLVLSFSSQERQPNIKSAMDCILEEDISPSNSSHLNAEEECALGTYIFEAKDKTEGDKVVCEIKVSLVEDKSPTQTEKDSLPFIDSANMTPTSELGEVGCADKLSVPTLHPKDRSDCITTHAVSGFIDSEKTVSTLPVHNASKVQFNPESSHKLKDEDEYLVFPCTLEEMNKSLKNRAVHTKPNQTTLLKNGESKNDCNAWTSKNSPLQKPLKQMPLALRLNQSADTPNQLIQRVSEPQNENKTAQPSTMLYRRPIPVSHADPSDVGKQLTTKKGLDKPYPKATKSSMTGVIAHPHYVIRSPTSPTSILKKVGVQSGAPYTVQYQQTDF